MKFFVALGVLSAALGVIAGPALEKRATVNDVPTIGYAAKAGTTGGSGGTTTTVTTLAALTTALTGTAKKVVVISGTITGNVALRVGSNTTVIGKTGAALNGVGLRVFRESNVIIRNLKISKVLAEAGDALGIQEASKVWVDHVDLSSDRDHDKDYYDGLLDVTHGSNGVSITNSKLSNHWKSSLVGHSDNNGDEDKAITVTFAYNYWFNLNSRTPSFRFGTGHIYNNVYDNNNDGINTRDGAQLLVENNIWKNATLAIYFADSPTTGYAVARGNDYGGANVTAPTGTLTTVPYSYTLTPTSSLRAAVVGSAGATLSI